MPKISLAGFKDPVRRPRFIIWTGVAVLVLAAVMITALGVTSTYWFCAEGCHKVQDDTITAYNLSTHSEISCMACHMPVNANPVVFILHKAEALGELYLTVTDNFELPLNGESHVALTMKSSQCTQCHNLENRDVTPSKGIKIEHEPHAEVNAACTVCHNRVAHNEDFDLELVDPATGEPNKKHADFMSMTACFRCHDLEDGAAAPGACSACHPADFELKPDNHKEKDFYPKGHAEMATEAAAEVAAAEAHGEEGAEGSEETSGAAEGEEQSLLSGPEAAYASGGEEVEAVTKEEVPALLEEQEVVEGEEHSIGAELPKVESIFYCSTCHTEKFCNDCHGMEMPHPAEFKEPKDAKDANGHPAISKQKGKAEKCEMCHGKNEKTHFCDSCHHGSAVGYEYDVKSPWTTKQHPKAVAQSGVKACTESCHTAKFCVDCHTGRKVLPTSHKAAGWSKPIKKTVTVYGEKPAEPSAKHALEAQKSIESCAVCHGEGGPNAKFCKSCHKLEMPHKAEFKTNHVSAKKNQAPCKQCHNFKELCSNCHHIDSSFSKPWIQVHGTSVNNNGPAGCVEKCHPEKTDCVKCHTSRKVVPASHKKGNFVRDYSSKDAQHVQLYTKDGEICTYCHAGAAAELPNSKFCKSCHKIEMPHPDGFGEKGAGNGGQHAEQFEAKKLKKATCTNCHKQSYCDSCHHEGSSTKVPWASTKSGAKVQHSVVVKKNGTEACFDCHEPTYCSGCHVRLN